MRASLRSVSTVVLATIVFAGAAAALGITVGNGSVSDLNPVSSVVYLCQPFLFVLLGGALALRLPRHWAGWLMLGLATSMVSSSFPEAILGAHERGQHWADSLVRWAAWLDNWTWVGLFAGLLFTILKFAGDEPSGRWWRRVGWAGMLLLAPLALALLFASGDSANGAHLEPTIVSWGIDYDTAETIMGPLFLGALGGLVAAVVALLIRYRLSRGADRAQLRWMLWAFGVLVTGLLVSIAASGIGDLVHQRDSLLVNAISVAQQLTILALPTGLYVSISRHGLFEIDRVISRSVSYTALTVLLTVFYVAIVTSATRLLPQRLGSLPVAAATLAVAAAFVPARRWLLSTIDRRFNRSRFDAELVVGAFAESVRHEGANDPSGRELLTAVQRVFQPATATVWMLPR